MAQELIDKIRAAAQAKGIDPDIALRIARAESSVDPAAKAKTSSAGGLFQVVDKTWKEFGGAPGKKFDPDENIRVGTDIISSNTNYLKKFLQRDPRPAEIYAAHYFGPTGAKSFLSAEPGTPMESLFSEKVIRDNPNLKGKTSGQVMATLETKMGGTPAPVAPAPAPNVSRETIPAPREPIPPSLPPMAAAPVVNESLTTPNQPAAPDRLAALGPGYQAALALSFLADTDEKENRDTEKEPGVAEKYLAEMDAVPRPSGLTQFADVKIRSPFAEPPQPQMLAMGGMVRRAGGSPETGEQAPTAEELEAASKPAFLTPKSGIGRKSSTKPEELYAAAVQGVSETPYNLVGAPVDLATMAMRPFGYTNEKPFLGSEDLKERALKAGIRQKPPEGAAARALYEMTQFGSGLVNPAAPVRGAVKAAEATGKAAKMLEDVTVGNIQRGQVRRASAQAENIPDTAYDPLRQRMEASGNLAYAVKPRGGTSAYTPEDLNRAKPISKLGELFQQYKVSAREADASDEIQNFIEAKAPKYFTDTYGTANDPLRLAINSRRIEPFGEDAAALGPYLDNAAMQGDSQAQLANKIGLEKAYDKRTGVQAYALRPEGNTVEDALFLDKMRKNISEKIGQEGAPVEMRNLPETMRDFAPSQFEEYPLMSETLRRLYTNQEVMPPNIQQALRTGEPIYDARPEMALLNPDRVIEALQEVPANKLGNMSFPEALIQGTQALALDRNYLTAVSQAAKGASVPRQVLDKFTSPVMDAPSFGGQWVTLDKSIATEMEGKLMNHSIGNYNFGDTYGTAYTGLPYGGKKAFDEGLVRVYSLRDEQGLPKVTVEMAKSDAGKGNTWNVSQIKGRFNSEPPSKTWDDIFNLLDKVDSQDGLKVIKQNSYVKSPTGETVQGSVVDWNKEYGLWKLSGE